MAILPDEDRVRIWRGLMRYVSSRFETVLLSKSDLRAAVDATDVWIDENQSAFNQALPQVARDNLTIEQKTLLLCAVALARTSIDLLRRVLGEVD